MYITMVYFALYVGALGLLAIVILLLVLKLLVVIIYHQQKRKTPSTVVGFFHPYCNAGGGGERVLWCAIRSLQNTYPFVHCVVYTGDTDSSADRIIQKAKETFGITLPKNVEFKFLHRRNWVEAVRYPILTLLGQSLGSIVLGMEALISSPPDVYLDTMGYAFTLPIFKYFGGCKTGCYVHYPTISTDMLSVVESRNDAFNNRPLIAKSKILTICKLQYYRIFAYMYGMAGRCADAVMVNSSWTYGHIQALWENNSIHKVFPPCDINGFLQLSLENRYKDSSSSKIIISIGQFRPEKNHKLQVQSFHHFMSNLAESGKGDYQLVLVGGCRNKGDEKRVAELKSLASKLQISNQVVFKTNISYQELKDLLSRAEVGIHTMANEHFGIGIVEFQAAGVLALAHKSGGPKMDIVLGNNADDCTGFLADNVESYSHTLSKIFELSVCERTEIAKRARISCERFSERNFEKDFLSAVSVTIEDTKKLR